MHSRDDNNFARIRRIAMYGRIQRAALNHSETRSASSTPSTTICVRLFANVRTYGLHLWRRTGAALLLEEKFRLRRCGRRFGRHGLALGRHFLFCLANRRRRFYGQLRSDLRQTRDIIRSIDANGFVRFGLVDRGVMVGGKGERWMDTLARRMREV